MTRKYDWDEWFSQRRFSLRQGEDYDCSQSSMCQQVRNAASVRGLRVAVIEDRDGITVIVVERREACPS